MIDLKPPATVAAQARKGLELRAKQPPSRRGGTAVGVARARDLANRKTLSPSTIGRMVSYFARHAVDVGKPGWGDVRKPSKGWQAWLLWGGNPGRAWAKAKWAQIQADREKSTQSAVAKSVERAPKRSNSPRARRNRWLKYVRSVQAPQERAIQRAVGPALKRQAERIVSRLKDVLGRRMDIKANPTPEVQRVSFFISAAEIAEIFGVTEEDDAMSEDIGDDEIRQALLAGWRHGFDQLDLRAMAWNPSFDPAPRLLGQLIVNVNQATKDNVERIILEDARQGKTIAEMATDLFRAESFSPTRALRVARTESNKAISIATQMAYVAAKDEGLDFQMEWLSAGDRATRDSHLAIDAQAVDIGGMFVLTLGENAGATAAHPGGFGIKSEDINCRCTLAPKFPDEED